MSDSNFIDDSETVKSRGREKRRTMRTGKQTKKRSGSETGHVKGLGNSLGYGFCTYCRPYLAIRQTNKLFMMKCIISEEILNLQLYQKLNQTLHQILNQISNKS